LAEAPTWLGVIIAAMTNRQRLSGVGCHRTAALYHPWPSMLGDEPGGASQDALGAFTSSSSTVSTRPQQTAQPHLHRTPQSSLLQFKPRCLEERHDAVGPQAKRAFLVETADGVHTSTVGG